MLGYLIVLFINLYSMQYDYVNKMVTSNTFTDGDQMINLNQEIFMPYFRLFNQNQEQPSSTFDLTGLDKDGLLQNEVSADKLLNYIDLVLV